MTSLSFPSLPPPVAEFLLMRLMLKEGMMRLRANGYSLLALAMRIKYPDLSDLKFSTVFAIADESIFAGDSGPAYLCNIMFHVVPNSILTGTDLMSLPKGTVLPTMESEKKLVVTTAGDGGPLVPMRINFVKIEKFDVVHNKRIVVHVVSQPFRHLNSWEEEYSGSCSYVKNNGVHETGAPVESMALRKFT